MFKKKIGKMVEVYINDMIVKSEKESNHARDLEESLGVLSRLAWNLIQRSVFLEWNWGFMIS